jgi:TonB family protein
MKILVYILILCFASTPGPEWPSKKFIKKYKYEELKGDLPMDLQIEGICNGTFRFPMYPTGINGVYDHIRKNTTYPKEAINQELTGTVLLSFVIGRDGYIEDVKIITSVHPSLDNEAIRVINCMQRWILAMCDDDFVRVQFNIPFKFSFK